jgi:hypothetical protein
MARIYALVAALMGTFAQAPAPTSPSAPVRIAPIAAVARSRSGPAAFADARVVVLSGDLRTRRRLVADWLTEAGPATTLAVPASWASPDEAAALAGTLVLPRAGVAPRALGYRAGDAASSHDAILRFVFEADDSDDGAHARPVERALQVGTGRALADVARILDTRRRAYTARAGRHAFEVARQHLRNLEQLAALRHERSRGDAAELEARFEAENLKWLVDHEASGAPLLVWPA